jgi:hypothetical protein
MNNNLEPKTFLVFTYITILMLFIGIGIYTMVTIDFTSYLHILMITIWFALSQLLAMLGIWLFFDINDYMDK